MESHISSRTPAGADPHAQWTEPTSGAATGHAPGEPGDAAASGRPSISCSSASATRSPARSWTCSSRARSSRTSRRAPTCAPTCRATAFSRTGRLKAEVKDVPRLLPRRHGQLPAGLQLLLRKRHARGRASDSQHRREQERVHVRHDPRLPPGRAVSVEARGHHAAHDPAAGGAGRADHHPLPPDPRRAGPPGRPRRNRHQRPFPEPEFGDPVPSGRGEVPVFWACGVTSQLAATSVPLPLVITHAPGHMFVSDLKDDELAIL